MAFLFFTVPAAGQAAGQTLSGEVPVPTAMQAAQTPTGLAASNNREVLEVTVCGDSLIHVSARPMDAPASTATRPWMLDPAVFCPGAAFQFNQTGDKATLITARMAISLSLKRGNLSFGLPQGESFLRENGNLPRTYYSAPGQPGSLYRIQDRFSPDSSEVIYGLGQHQSGLFNYRGSTVELGQNNTDVAIPLLVSSKGYAILWNTASFSYMDNGDFNLYEDEGDSYRYEKGAHSIIPLHWDDAARTLTIGAREGSYPGMNPGHTFNVVIVAAGHGAGAEPVQTPDKAIHYAGEKIEVKF